MKKYEVVKEHKEFDNIIQNGKYIKGKNFVIYNKESNYSYPRFGLAVGKKIGNAVVRNKIKRQLRSIITSNKNLFQNHKDYIIIVKRSSLLLSFEQMNQEIIKLQKEKGE